MTMRGCSKTEYLSSTEGSSSVINGEVEEQMKTRLKYHPYADSITGAPIDSASRSKT